MNKEVLEYINNIPLKYKDDYIKIFNIFKENLDKNIECVIQYGMPTFIIPKSIYPSGYHVSNEPLGIVSIAAQKQHIAIYHMGMYINEENNLMNWYKNIYISRNKYVPDLGKSCIRFKSVKSIDYQLIEELSKKISMNDFIDMYEKVRKKVSP